MTAGAGWIGEINNQFNVMKQRGNTSFAGVIDSLAVGDGTPAALTAAAVALYASTDDFTALHGVKVVKGLEETLCVEMEKFFGE